jgi:hypothetical protein
MEGPMRRLAIAASVAALTLIGGHAFATTYFRYDFIALSAVNYDPIADKAVDADFQGSFTGFLETPPTKTTDILILPLCRTTVGGVSRDCWNARLRPDGGALGPAEDYSEAPGQNEVELWWVPPAVTDSSECYLTFGLCQTYAYLFPHVAFSTPGRYLSDPGNPDQKGILRVSVVTSTDASSTDVGSVPEPGVWSLLIAGFAGVGAALRLQRRRFLRA